MKQLNRNALAAVKRTAQNVKPLVNKKVKLAAKIVELGNQIKAIEDQIEVWEAPIKVLTDGYSSTEYLEELAHPTEGVAMVADVQVETPAVESIPEVDIPF